MRVTHVITRLVVGGAQENTVSTVLGLLDKPGLQVDLVSGPTTGPEGSLESLFASKPDVLKIHPDLVRPVRPWNDWLALRKLRQTFLNTRPDIVHTHSAKAGILGRIAAKQAKVPIIIHTIHGPSFGSFQNDFSNFVFRSAEKYAARFTTHFISVANAMTEQHLAVGIGRPEQFTRIFSGFHLEPFLNATNDLALRQKLGIAEDDFVVGKVARLFELKGHDDLIEVAPELVKRFPRIKFLLVGDGPWRQRFQFRTRTLGLESHFIFTGLVPPHEVPAYVGIMDALVHLSRREGLPRALPQALAAGKPVVAFDCDGAKEVCISNETGFLVRPGDFHALIEALIKLANNPALRRELGSHGQQMVQQNFPVEQMVENIHKLYMELGARFSIS